MGGVLDQRMDWLTGVLLLGFVVSAEAWIESVSWRRLGVFWFFLIFLVLIRPVFLPVMFLMIGYLLLCQRFKVLKIGKWWQQVGFTILVSVVVGVVFFIPNFEYLYYYYFVWNVDVGRNLSLGELVRIIADNFRYLMGRWQFLGLLFLMAIPMLKKDNWKYVGIVLLMPVFLIVSRSVFNPYIFIGPIMLAYYILVRIWVLDTVWWKRFLILSLILIMLVNGMSKLANNVLEVDFSERDALNNVVSEIDKVCSNGCTVAGVSSIPATIYSYKEFVTNEMNIKLGRSASLITDFKLDKTKPINEASIGAVVEVLQDACVDEKTVLVVYDSEQENLPGDYLFFREHNDLVSRAWQISECLINKKVIGDLVYENKKYLIYF